MVRINRNQRVCVRLPVLRQSFVAFACKSRLRSTLEQARIYSSFSFSKKIERRGVIERCQK